MSEQIYPPVGTVWVHTNGNFYKVEKVTNLDATEDRRDEYPIMVSYRNIFTNQEWSKPARDWFKSRSRVSAGLTSDEHREELKDSYATLKRNQTALDLFWPLLRDIEAILEGFLPKNGYTTPEIVAQSRMALKAIQ